MSGSAYAQCKSADLCDEDVCNQRQSIVHPTCDQPRSCSNISDQAELKRRLKINQDCLTARTDVSACYSKADANHDKMIEAVRNTIANCQSKITN
jgi:hypothetical protein